MSYSKYLFVFDTDGTIRPVKKKEERYEDLVPCTSVVEKICFYRETGAKIVFFTSCNISSYGENLGLTNKNTARVLTEWLDKWGTPYDEIFHDKPWPGHKSFYVDDRSVRPDEFLTYTPEELAKCCEASRAEKD